jgi:hypothetical protein
MRQSRMEQVSNELTRLMRASLSLNPLSPRGKEMDAKILRLLAELRALQALEQTGSSYPTQDEAFVNYMRALGGDNISEINETFAVFVQESMTPLDPTVDSLQPTQLPPHFIRNGQKVCLGCNGLGYKDLLCHVCRGLGYLDRSRNSFINPYTASPLEIFLNGLSARTPCGTCGGGGRVRDRCIPCRGLGVFT